MAGGLTRLCRDCFWLDEAAVRCCPHCGSPRLIAHVELGVLGIAHLDCDAFYASVEKRDRPELRDLPVIVGGGKRGVVTTACYIARISGVRSAMPMFKALKLCPQAVVIKPDFARYRAESRKIMEKLRALTPLVQTLSLDEAWLDLRGTRRLHGASPAVVMARLQAEIELEIGLGVSVGLAPNRFLAKIASDLDKPKGFAVIGAAEARSFLAPRPVSILPGVGPVLARKLVDAGYVTVGALAAAEVADLGKQFGVYGFRLAKLAHGIDARPVDPDQVRKSLSAETTFNDDLRDLADLEHILWPLCERVARQARREAILAGAVVLKLRDTDFRIVTRRRAPSAPTQTAKTIFALARDLLRAEVGRSSYRLIGVGLVDLLAESGLENTLFSAPDSRTLDAERAIDTLSGRFGEGAVVRGRSLRR